MANNIGGSSGGNKSKTGKARQRRDRYEFARQAAAYERSVNRGKSSSRTYDPERDWLPF